MHEEPPVFNYRVDRKGPAVKPGLVVAIEPMIVAGAIETFIRDDEWTVTTSDGADAAHWEHSVAVHERRHLGAHRRRRRRRRTRPVRRRPRPDPVGGSPLRAVRLHEPRELGEQPGVVGGALHEALHVLALGEGLDELVEHLLELRAPALGEGDERDDVDARAAQSIGTSSTAIAIAVRLAVIVMACGTARCSVNAVDERRSRSSAPST